MNEILINIISILVTSVVLPLISFAGTKFITWLNTKVKNDKLKGELEIATNIVTNAVRCVFQTYVESLKAEGKFTPESQNKALNKAKEIVINQITSDVKNHIESNYGSFDIWLTTQIEATIDLLKNKC